MFDNVRRDVRFALRGFTRAPAFALVAILTLALGIGANTAIFSVVSGVLLRPLPFPDPDRLARIEVGRPFSARQLDGLAERLSGYAGLSGAGSTTLTLTGDGVPEEVAGSLVSATHMEVFGVAPERGRAFLPDDGVPGAEPIVVLSHAFWQRRYGGDPGVVGRVVDLGGEGSVTRTVVGIMPPSYAPFSWRSDVFVPLAVERGTHDYTDMLRFALVGRLEPGVSLAAASRDLRQTVAAMTDGSEGAYFTDPNLDEVRLVSYLDSQVSGIGQTLWLLLGAVGLVLLIACTNVANLSLARASSRRREIAIRTALGAERHRIARQLLTESILLATLGGALGYVTAFVGLPVLVRVVPAGIPRADQISVDGGVLLFTLAISLAAGVLFGLAPALGFSRSVESVLREDGRSASLGRRRFRLGQVLIAAEMALCVVLVSSAGLLIKSFWLAGQVDPGFQAEGLHTLRLRPSIGRYPDVVSQRRYFSAVEAEIRAVPGVESVGATQVLPMTNGNMGVGISPDGSPVPPGERPMGVGYRIVTPGYGPTLGVPLLAGRWLSETDREDDPPVGLVNALLADRLFPGRDAVGEEVHWDNGETWFRVVGVVGNVHHTGLDQDSRMEAYVPFAQEPWTDGLHLVVRSGADPAIPGRIREASWSVDADVPVSGEASMEGLVTASTAGRRFQALLFTVFGTLALILGAVGVYGVTAYTVGQRAREIGIRMALGAKTGSVVWGTLTAAMSPVAFGLAFGFLAAILCGRLLKSLLFQVAPLDPGVLATVLAALAIVALVATFLPARRASSTDPMVVLDRV